MDLRPPPHIANKRQKNRSSHLHCFPNSTPSSSFSGCPPGSGALIHPKSYIYDDRRCDLVSNTVLYTCIGCIDFKIHKKISHDHNNIYDRS